MNIPDSSTSFARRPRTGFIRCLPAVLALSLPALTQAKEEWLPLVPANAVAVITVKNTPELMQDWDKSAIGRFLADPAVEKWLAPAFENGEAPWDKWTRETTGVSVRESVANYPGATLVAVLWPDEESGRSEPIAVTFSEAAGKEAELQANHEKLFESQAKENEELKSLTVEIEGATVRYLAEDENEDTPWQAGWTLLDGVEVSANDRAAMTQAILALSKGATADNSGLITNFKRFQEIAGGEGDVTIYLDTGILLEKMTAKLAEAGGGQAGNPFGPEMFLGALSLDEIRGLGLSFDLRDADSQFDVALLHQEKPQGLIVKLLHGTDTKVELPGFVPADAASASVSRWSFLGLYDGLMAALNKLGPMIGGMVQMQIGEMEQGLGIKLRDDLFATTDDQVVQVSAFAKGDGSASEVTGIKLKDPARFTAALEALKALAGNGLGVFEESDFAGFKIWTIKPNLAAAPEPGAQSNEFAYSIAKDHFLLCVGTQDALHKVLNRMNDPSGPTLWDDDGVRAAIAALPDNRTGVGVTDGSALVKEIINKITQAQNTLGAQIPKAKGKGKGKGKAKAADNDGAETFFDPKAAPADEVFARYFGLSSSGSYSLPDASHFRVVSQPAEAR